MQQRPLYRVEPALLPPAGTKTVNAFGHTSATLEKKKERLTHWHLDHLDEQHRRLMHTAKTMILSGPSYASPRAGLAPVSAREASKGLPFDEGYFKSQPRARNPTMRTDPRLKGQKKDAMPPGMDLLIDGLRRRMQSKGMNQAMKLEKFYASFDENGDGQLNFEEFKTGLMTEGILNSEAECEFIFNFFDSDRTGSIDYREFGEALTGHLNERRKKVVKEAFDSLDTSGDGLLTTEDLKDRVRAYNHPDVKSGARTEESVLREFLEGFDTINSDGTVTLAEFEHFYEYTSAQIASDDLFEATVRNAWGLSGASGGSCLRVRVTMEGRGGIAGMTEQKLVEIRPDLTISQHHPDFFDKVVERLEQMGYHNVSNIEVVQRGG